ncbi:aminoacyl-tRNA hydrolase [Amphibacillus jilinensis]|uniref:aminoacyl-tRNA hydrolase n=1 Tax=Amphibacillus jilinensis TaxID=1216008 RepID=UPI00031CACFF|nr:aminoacyl-tRNA hydrolase [Amphibacillus jilinensis]
MKCIVGLGNPGRKYNKTRHNVGFMVINRWCEQHGWELQKNKFNGHYTVETINNDKLVILLPQTYMNLSGESVKPLIDFYQIPPENLLVIYDDLDLPVGKIRLRQTGGHGGHNGMRSIIEHLGTKQFNRIRIGIDRPEHDVTVTDHVLGKFSKSEIPALVDSIDKSVSACESWLNKPFIEVMNEYN